MGSRQTLRGSNDNFPLLFFIFKVLPKGLRDEEVERGNIKRPPVPHIPPADPIGDMLKNLLGPKITR